MIDDLTQEQLSVAVKIMSGARTTQQKSEFHSDTVKASLRNINPNILHRRIPGSWVHWRDGMTPCERGFHKAWINFLFDMSQPS